MFNAFAIARTEQSEARLPTGFGFHSMYAMLHTSLRLKFSQ
jgi:hypothetical protein